MHKFIGLTLAVALFPVLGHAAPTPDTAVEKRRQAEIAEKHLVTKKALDAVLPSVTFEDTKFETALTDLAKAAGISIKPDWQALDGVKIKRDTPVSARMRNVKASKALVILMDGVGTEATPLAHYINDDGDVVITTRAQYIKANTVEREYDISDIIAARKSGLEEAKAAEEIVALIVETVDSESWESANAASGGTIKYDGGKLKVKQLKENHKTQYSLLNHLRETQDLKLPEDVGGDGL